MWLDQGVIGGWLDTIFCCYNSQPAGSGGVISPALPAAVVVGRLQCFHLLPLIPELVRTGSQPPQPSQQHQSQRQTCLTNKY